MPIKLL